MSVFYSDRHTMEYAEGRRPYLCTLCDSRMRSSRRGKPLTDGEVRQLIDNASIIGTAWRP